MSIKNGVLIGYVEKNCAIERAGLLAGDNIIAFDDEPVSGIYNLQSLLTGEFSNREPASFDVLRK